MNARLFAALKSGGTPGRDRSRRAQRHRRRRRKDAAPNRRGGSPGRAAAGRIQARCRGRFPAQPGRHARAVVDRFRDSDRQVRAALRQTVTRRPPRRQHPGSAARRESATLAWEKAHAGALADPLQRRADALRDLAIVLDHAAEIAPEPVLVELFAGLRVPQPAAVGRELVAQHQRRAGLEARMPELELVVDEVDAGIGEHRAQHRVDIVRQRLHLRDLVRRRPAQHADVVLVAQRVVQRVALEEELEDRLGELRALGDAVALRHRARAHVAHDALDGNHLHRLHQRLALVQHADEVRRNARRGELSHHERVDPVVGLALQRKLGELDAVERRHVVAVMHDEIALVVRRVDRLGLPLVQLLPLFHVALLRRAPASRSPLPARRCRSSRACSPSAAASAARASSGVLFCCERCAAMMCVSRDVSMRARMSAAASLCRWPRRPAIRCLSGYG